MWQGKLFSLSMTLLQLNNSCKNVNRRVLVPTWSERGWTWHHLNLLCKIYTHTQAHTHTQAAYRHLICWDLHLWGVMSRWMSSSLSREAGRHFQWPETEAGVGLKGNRWEGRLGELKTHHVPLTQPWIWHLSPLFPHHVQEWSPNRTPVSADTKSRLAGCNHSM